MIIFGEVGAKDRRSTSTELIEQADRSFEAGATLVLVEAAELVIDGQPNTAMLDDLARHLDMGRVMIELPGPWIPGVRTCDIEALKKLLVNLFGPDVNVANVAPDTIIDFEATHRPRCRRPARLSRGVSRATFSRATKNYRRHRPVHNLAHCKARLNPRHPR